MTEQIQKQECWATGRRKTSVARVRLLPGEGKWQINGRTLEEYFPIATLRAYIQQPFIVANVLGRYDVIANIKGGGISGQAGALRHGIARALCIADSSLRQILKKSGLLTRDARMKERKKSGQPGARKRFQFSKR